MCGSRIALSCEAFQIMLGACCSPPTPSPIPGRKPQSLTQAKEFYQPGSSVAVPPERAWGPGSKLNACALMHRARKQLQIGLVLVDCKLWRPGVACVLGSSFARSVAELFLGLQSQRSSCRMRFLLKPGCRSWLQAREDRRCFAMAQGKLCSCLALGPTKPSHRVASRLRDRHLAAGTRQRHGPAQLDNHRECGLSPPFHFPESCR